MAAMAIVAEVVVVVIEAAVAVAIEAAVTVAIEVEVEAVAAATVVVMEAILHTIRSLLQPTFHTKQISVSSILIL